MDRTTPTPVTAVVTGGASGIGSAVVERLVRAGIHVVVVDLITPTEKVSGVSYIEGSSADASVLDASVAMAQGGAEQFGIFVACAGISRPGPSSTYDLALWQQLIDVNLSAVFLGARRAAQAMHSGGAIVAIGSVHAHLGFGGRAAYSASKAGVVGLARSLAIEWAPLGIRVNTVSPGYIETSLVARNLAMGVLDESQLLARIPTHRLGTPEDVANAVWFLSSPESAYITGIDLVVDGGLATYGLPLN